MKQWYCERNIAARMQNLLYQVIPIGIINVLICPWPVIDIITNGGTSHVMKLD